MELILASGLVGLGAMLGLDNSKKKDDKKQFMAKVPLNKQPNGSSIYESNRSYDIFQSEWKNSGPLYKESMKKGSNVIFGGPPQSPFIGEAKVGTKLNKVDFADKTLPVEFNSFMTYDDALIDVQNVKTNANQDNNRTKNNMMRPESGGTSGISLTGEPINSRTFTHNNMQPFFGGQVKQSVDEFATRGVFENFTGDQDSYQHKKEKGLFFEPQKNVSNVYGAQSLDGFQMERYVSQISNIRSNETPVEKQYIAPNLNDGYNNQGGGFIKGNGGTDAIQYRIPKTTDELRVKNKPKVSYYGRIVSGAHIAKPGKVGTMFKNRPDTFWVETPDRYFTTVGAVEAPAARPCQVLKYTNRKTTELKTRINPAAPTHGSKGVVRGKYRVSSKQTYEADGPRNATIEGQWSIMGLLGLDNTPNDYGKKSIRMRPNGRTETGTKTHTLNLHSKVPKGETRNGQKAKRTMKESTESNSYNGNMGMTAPSRGFVYDPSDRPDTTMKEMLEDNEHAGFVDGGEVSRGIVYDPNDIARHTMKETNIDNLHSGMMTNQQPSRGHVYDPDEYEMRPTHKQLLEVNEHMGNYTSEIKRTYTEKGPDAPTTHRQTTSVAYMTNANKNVNGGYEVTDIQAVGTNRMFSVEYTGNSGNTQGTAQPLSYEDAYNATMKSVRDTQDQGFTPGAQGPSAGVDANMIHATTNRMGDIQNQYLNERGVAPSTMTNSIPQLSNCNLTQDKMTVPNEPIADRINPNILDAFKQNPYTQSLNSWA
jgi:hypothetical protein